MRQWSGIRDDLSLVGSDALPDATGVSFYIDGELRRRPGLSYLTNVGGVALSAFRTPVTGAWLTIVDSAGNITADRLSTGALSTISTGYNVAQRLVTAPIGPRMYWTNDFDRMKVWDGLSSTVRDAGIAAPGVTMLAPTSTGSGTVTAGVHLIRYRYVDSQSPSSIYRSNPATAVSYTAAGSTSLTFTIGTSGTAIIRSTDPKADTIQIEMTLVDGSDYYVVGTVANSATTYTIDISDTLLAVNDLTSLLDDFGHEQPPAGACLFECRGYGFLCGVIERTYTVGVTSNSTAVTGTGFSTMWVGRLIRFGTDSTAYTISAITSTTITLATAYVGTTGSVTATIYSTSPNRTYWSRQYDPESWKATVRARDVLYGTGDRVVGGCDFQGDAWFFGQRSMCRLVFADDPSLGEVNPVPGYHGLWSARCLMPLDGILYGWGANGAWTVSGGAPRWISKRIDTTVAALIDTTKSAQFLATYDPIEKCITWRFVALGDTTPRMGLRYDITGQRWSLVQYRQGIDAGCVVSDDNGYLRAAVSDDTNQRTYYHSGATDGVPSTSTGSYTADLGGSTTLIPTVDSLPTGTGTDLSKLVLYRVSTGETSVVTSNTANSITIATPFATSVVIGESVYVGSIPCSFKTGWWVGQDLSTKERPDLQLLFNPSSTGSLRIKLYRDFQTTPYTWTSNSDDTWPDGVTVANGQNYIAVNLSGSLTQTDGFAPVPMPSDWGRAWRVEVIVLDPAGTLRLLDVRLVTVSKREEGLEIRE